MNSGSSSSLDLSRADDHAPAMDAIEKARRVIGIETESLQRLADRLDDSFGQAVTLLKETLDRRNKIVVIGVGKSGNCLLLHI